MALQRDASCRTDVLLAELNDPATTHTRRREIGEHLAAHGDPRPGVGVRVDDALPGRAPDIDWIGVAGVHRIDSVRLSRYPEPYTETVDAEEEVRVSPFCVARYPVTNAQFAAFVDAPDGWSVEAWWEGLPAPRGELAEPTVGLGNHPRDAVTWVQAVAFCRWLSARLPAAGLPWKDVAYEPHGVGRIRRPDCTDGWVVRLPLELEWQLAAGDGRPGVWYPWGGYDPDPLRANTEDAGLGRPIAVGMYPHGASPAGALDMCGNVWEWGLMQYDVWRSPRYVRYGGSFRTPARRAAIFARSGKRPDVAGAGVGFRPVYGPALERIPSPWPAGISRTVLSSRTA